MLTRRTTRLFILALGTIFCAAPATIAGNRIDSATKYCRFQVGDTIAYGVVEGDQIRQLAGDLFGEFTQTSKMHSLKEVTLLVPSNPTHVFAMAGNYKSHLGEQDSIITKITTETTVTTNRKTGETISDTNSTTVTRNSGEIPEKFQVPQLFFKSPSCLQRHEGQIVIPNDAEITHFEAELVIVIGKKTKNVSKEKAWDYVLGVTCGNDVSARVWQKKDVQWWRAKGSDTFGPCGPFIVSGLDYGNLLLQLRLNGKTMQKESTSQLINDIPTTVSFISQHVTLRPGDLIFTGTPGKTSKIETGDIVEVELEGVGVLRNKVVAEP